MRLRLTAEINRLDALSAAIEAFRPCALPHCIQNRPVNFRGTKDRNQTVIDTTILR
jgi:hypothetical protein